MAGQLLILEGAREIEHRISNILPEYDIRWVSNAEECLQVASQNFSDLILLDHDLLGSELLELCSQIRLHLPNKQIQLLVFGSRMNDDDRLMAFDAGADEVFDKNIRGQELAFRIQNQLRLRSALARACGVERKLEGYSRELERIVESRSMAIQATQDAAVFALAKLADSRDTETGEHLIRMRAYSQMIAEQLRLAGPYRANITDQFLQDLYRSSPLHDIGKVGIPDAVLLKPGRLDPEEFELMKQHTVIGAKTLNEAARSNSCGNFFSMAVEIARSHHERWDGSGYPDGLSGPHIPLSARIVSVADVYDALTSKRVYKEAIPPEQAREMIVRESGRQFDPAVIEAFQAIFQSLVDFAADQEHFKDFHAAKPRSSQNAFQRPATTDQVTRESILLIESNPTQNADWVGWMEAAGFSVRSCVNMDNVQDVLTEFNPQVVLAPWNTSRGSAKAFTSWIREQRLPEYVYLLALAPADRSEDKTVALAAGFDEFNHEPLSRDGLLTRLNTAIRVVELENQLRAVQRIDPLTGLATPRYLEEQLKREWNRTRAYQLPLSCIVIDVDQFHQINQEHGDAVGDLVLQQLARMVTSECREVDYICRLERDRLLLVMPECGEITALRVAKRLRIRISKLQIEYASKRVEFTASMGIAQRSAETRDLQALLAQAERVLVAAKRTGRGQILVQQQGQQRSDDMLISDWLRQQLEHVTVAQLMKSPVVSLQVDQAVSSVIPRLLEQGLNSAPVVDAAGKLVGFVSEKDLMQSMRHSTDCTLAVGEIMHRDVVCFNEHEPAMHVYEFLSSASLRFVVVLRDNQPVGLISRGDCLRWFNRSQLPAFAESPGEAVEAGQPQMATLGEIRDLLSQMQSASGHV